MAGDIRSELDLDIARALQQIDRLEAAASRATRVDVDPRGLDAAVRSAKQLDRGLDGAADEAGRLDRNVKSAGSQLGALLKTVGAAAALRGLKALVDVASDLEESTSKAATVFGESFEQVSQFADGAATSVGLARDQALEAAGTFGNLFTATGLARDAAASMSVGIVQLAADLASFNNLEVSEATEKLRAGLVGEAEPLRTLGINITAAATQAKALELGLVGVGGELTTAAKLQANYALILEQSTTAQGDFARTSDGLANQTRIVKAELRDLAADLGQELLPVALELVSAMRDDLIPALRDAGPALAQVASAGGSATIALFKALLPLLEAAAPVLQVIANVLNEIPPGLLAVGIGALSAGRAVQLLTGGVGGATGAIQGLGTVLAGGRGLAGAFAIAATAGSVLYRAIEALSGTGLPDFSTLTEDLRKFGQAGQEVGAVAGVGGVEGILRAVDQVVEQNQSTWERLGTTVSDTIATVGRVIIPFGDVKGTAEKMRESLAQVDGQLADLARQGAPEAEQAFDRLADAAAQQGISRQQLLASMPEYQQAVLDQARATNEAARASRDAAGEIDGMESAAARAERQVSDLTAALDELIGGTVGVDKAVIAFEEGLDDFADTLKENRRGISDTTDLFDFTNEKVREVTGGFADMAEEIVSVAKAQADAGRPFGEVTRTLRDQIDALTGVLRAAGLTEDQIGELVARYNLIPDEITTELKTIYTSSGSPPNISSAGKTLDQIILRNLADGAIIEPRPGGTLVRVGEAGSREVVVPTDDPRRALHLLTASGVLDVAARALPAQAFTQAAGGGQSGPLIGALTVVGADMPQATSRRVVRDLRDEVWLQDGSFFTEAV